MMFARIFALVSVAAACLSQPAGAAPSDWPSTVAQARGQAVYWHAWGGDENVNRYIQWTASQVKQRFGIDLHHVKVADIGQTVTQLVAEKAAGRTTGGRIDLMWLNGENFAALKERGLLYGPITSQLPHFALVDTLNKPTTVLDFTVPTDGFESPWGMAQVVFFADSARESHPPRTLADLAGWAKAHPGRFTYPAPPDFSGTTFLKQALLDLTEDRSAVYAPMREEDFARVTAPLWRFIDALHPSLWRKGTVFPANYPAMRQLMNDGELDVAFSLNPAEAAVAISKKLLPATVRSFVLDGGTIGNTHFVAVPASAAAKEGALVVADFLLSPEAQGRKANPELWGDPTVLDLDRLTPADRRHFDIPRGGGPRGGGPQGGGPQGGGAMPSPADLRRVLAEPHPSWTARIEREWQKRYTR